MQVCLNMCEQRRFSRNFASQFAEKVIRKKCKTVLKSWREPLLNSSKYMKCLYLCTLKFWIILNMQKWLCAFTGIEITDFQMSDKTSNTIRYLLDILKIHQTSCQHVWVLEFKHPQLFFLLQCIMSTFDMHKYSFCEFNTYCIIIFLLEKCYSWQKAIKQ